MSSETILVVDDDQAIVGAIAAALEKEGYRVLRAYDGMEALDKALDPELRLILMDVMMPRLDGLSAVLRIRERRNLPVIVLSAKSEESDKVLGLSMGADDYVTKPFSMQELAARVRSQLRRYTSLGDVNAAPDGVIASGRLSYDPATRELTADGEPVKLTNIETGIVDLLMRNLGRVFPAEEIYRRVWGEEAFSSEGTVMVHIRRIREKIELNPREPDYLKVVWGIGYKMEKSKSIIGFLAFILGVSLVLEGALYFGTALTASGSRRWMSDSFQSDWRDTTEFRSFVSGQLEKLITMGAGGKAYQRYGGSSSHAETGLYTDKLYEAQNQAINEWIHERIKEDQNVLYIVEKDGRVCFSNTDADLAAKLPEDYGFLLRFDGEKVTVRKDGKELDVYGDGYYRYESIDEPYQWYVPGYKNFTVDEAASKVRVTMAVIDEPQIFIKGNYGGSGSSEYNHLYYLKRNLQAYRQEMLGHAARLGAGVALVLVYVLLRRDKKRADQAVARCTGHIWFEVKVLAALLLVFFCFPRTEYLGDVWTELVYSSTPVAGTASSAAVAEAIPYGDIIAELEESGLSEEEIEDYLDSYYYAYDYSSPIEQTTNIVAAVAVLSENGGWLLREYLSEVAGHSGGLLVVLWGLYLLIVNDWRYNKRPWKHGVIGMLAAGELKYPLQKRLSRMNGWLGLAVALLWLEVLALLVLQTAEMYLPSWAIWNLLGLPWLLALGVYGWIAWRQRKLWTDFGAVADQAAAIRAGALEQEIALQEDSDLYPLADDLNHIREGLHQAVEERTHSEQMKVELVTNVSHDLKTPLTSIISYTELLSQEPLEPPASEYVQIMAEKAQRLKAMVQDVFEVSKAASGQLPVKLERLDYARLLRQTLADMAQAIDSSGLALRASIPETEVPITADSDRLYRVFQNLIGNALKYSLAGSRVYLTLTVEDGQAAASVRNTSAAELKPGADYTARFVRGDESRTDGGSGLGLSIADSFARACGGRLAVTTEADLFTAVVTFPVTEA